jgi:hypothetical protein
MAPASQRSLRLLPSAIRQDGPFDEVQVQYLESVEAGSS